MRKQLLVLVSFVLLLGCSKQGDNITSTSGTTSTQITTTKVSETSKIETTVTTTTTLETTVTTTEQTTVATTVNEYTRLKSFMTSIDNTAAIIDYLNSSGKISKSYELTSTMSDSFVNMLKSYQEVSKVNWTPTLRITFNSGELYIARKNDEYRFGLSPDNLIGEFTNTDFLNRLAAYERNSFLNYLNTKGDEASSIESYFMNVPYDELSNVYSLTIDDSLYGLKSFYDFTNEIYYSDFFDIEKFETNRVTYDYVNQIGYLNACIYELSGISYTTCSNYEIDVIRQHARRFLNDGTLYLEQAKFYKELGYDSLELQSEFEEILYKQFDEELYRERNLEETLDEDYRVTVKDYKVSSLANDIVNCDAIVIGRIASENKLFDYGEVYEGSANYLIYSDYDVVLEKALKGEISDNIHLIFAGGYLDGTFTNAEFYEDLKEDGIYLMMLDYIGNEVDENLYEIHNIYMGNDLMYFDEGLLSVWSKRAEYNSFIPGASLEQIVKYINEVVNYHN